MNNSSAKSTGFIYLLLYTVLVSTISIAGKIVYQQEASPLELIAIQYIFAAAALWAYFLCFRANVLRLDRAGLIACMQAGIVNCVSACCYFFALSYIDASLLTVIYVTALIPAVMFLLMIRGEYPSRLDLFRFVVALIGIYLFFDLVGDVSWIGLVLATVTPFFAALYLTIIQLRLGDYDSQIVTLYTMTFTAIMLGVVYLAQGYRAPQFDAVTWAAVLWIAIVATAIARLFLFAGVKIAGSRQAALLIPLDTLLAVVFAVWVLGESLTLQQWLGTFFVMASVALGAKAKSDPVHADATKAADLQSIKENINE